MSRATRLYVQYAPRPWSMEHSALQSCTPSRRYDNLFLNSSHAHTRPPRAASHAVGRLGYRRALLLLRRRRRRRLARRRLRGKLRCAARRTIASPAALCRGQRRRPRRGQSCTSAGAPTHASLRAGGNGGGAWERDARDLISLLCVCVCVCVCLSLCVCPCLTV